VELVLSSVGVPCRDKV